jgi:hypothetical protein
MAPASIRGTSRCTETPKQGSGSPSAQTVGTGPRCRGSNEGCRLIPPLGARASVSARKIWSKCSETSRSGRAARMAAAMAGPFTSDTSTTGTPDRASRPGAGRSA